MTLPAFVRSQVDPAAVTKVTRLFNNTIGDVLAELIQNARRAGAASVRLTTRRTDDEVRLRVADDGTGIDDPAVILALGRSGWDDQLLQREDPAGMGVFSLAGRHVVIRSRPRGADVGWRIEIAPEAWEDGRPIGVATCDCHPGTEIDLPLDTSWSAALIAGARGAALHCPIPVLLDGKELQRRDWLDGACAVFAEAGVRIGVFDDRRATVHSPSINFHGVTVPGGFAVIAETTAAWCARVDIVDAPDLQLVLPARKEMVENAALVSLRQSVRRAIYRHIATGPEHRLSHDQWREARALGVDLAEAAPRLARWAPTSADLHVGFTQAEVGADDRLLIVEGSIPAIEQSARLALTAHGDFAGRLVSPNAKMAGYSWYDRLTRITGMAFDVRRGDTVVRYSDTDFPGLESGSVDAATLILSLSGPTGETTASFPAPAVIEFDDGNCWGVEEAAIVIASPEAVTVDDIVDLLEGTCFSASDDHDADSWETQHDRFLLDARDIAVRLLHGDDAAAIERLRAVLSLRVQWFVPEGRQFNAIIGRHGLELSIEAAPPAPV